MNPAPFIVLGLVFLCSGLLLGFAIVAALLDLKRRMP